MGVFVVFVVFVLWLHVSGLFVGFCLSVCFCCSFFFFFFSFFFWGGGFRGGEFYVYVFILGSYILVLRLDILRKMF